METDGKRLLLAVGLAMGLMLVWNLLFPPDPAEKSKPESDSSEETAEGGDSEAESDKPKPADGNKAESDEGNGETKVVRGPEKTVTLASDGVVAEFSSYGGVLKSWKLMDERFRVKGQPLDLVRTTPEEGLPFATSFAGSTFSIPEAAEWQLEQKSEREVHFSWSSNELRVQKRYKLVPEDFMVELEVEFKNLSEEKVSQALVVSTTSFQDPTADTGGGWARLPQEWKAACFVGGELEEKGQKGVRKKTREWSGRVKWTGFSHSYFLAAFSPKADEEARFTCRAEPVKGRKGAMKASLEFPAITLAAGDPAYTWKVTSFYGPKYLDKLDGLDKLVGYDTGLREAVDLGWFELIARPMLWVLKWFYSFVGNWAIAIVLLTLMVKGLLLPWTHKSMVSMKKMSKLAPRMKEIQKKYKDDKSAQQARIMEMYKQEGVNPLSGCLPMLLQMPIWIALYRMLMKAAELYHAPAIPGWIDDLTAPDPIYVLPVLLVIVMFVQAKFTPTTGDGAQQKMLKYGMPLMFGGMSFVFPAGLTLYIFTNTLLTGIHHVVLRRGDKDLGKAAAAAKTKGKSDKTPPESEDSEPVRDDESEGDFKSSADDEDSGDAGSRPSAKKKTKKKKRKKGKRKR
ncbi:MAG: membrane protein insertase YidC [Deltaproteobacteria bacterium]|nr:membrane protein insertase YidC [Deltaproteobacteria bacterium]